MFHKYTLVVVDMQPVYTTDAETIEHVAREVRLARERDSDIIFLWVPYFSPLQDELFKATHAEILDQVKGYDRSKWQEAEKIFSDGTRNVFSTCEWKHFSSKRFRICGVNTDLCVLATVKGLLESTGPYVEEIEVVTDACRTSNPETDNTKVWKMFPTNPRLTLIDGGAAAESATQPERAAVMKFTAGLTQKPATSTNTF